MCYLFVSWKSHANLLTLVIKLAWLFYYCTITKLIYSITLKFHKVNAARKSKVDDNTARMQSIKQLGV